MLGLYAPSVFTHRAVLEATMTPTQFVKSGHAEFACVLDRMKRVAPGLATLLLSLVVGAGCTDPTMDTSTSRPMTAATTVPAAGKPAQTAANDLTMDKVTAMSAAASGSGGNTSGSAAGSPGLMGPSAPGTAGSSDASTTAVDAGQEPTVSAALDAAAPKRASDAGSSSTSSSAGAEIIQIKTPTFVFDARVAGPPDGDVVFLLHGFPETSYEWRAQLPALAEAGYRAVAPDQRGYSLGARPSAVDEYTVAKLATDVLEMADALGAKRFHVVGHDWGSAVAWALGKLAEDRVASLTALSVPHPDAFAQALSDMNGCQYQASSYFEILSAPDAEDTLLLFDATGLRAIYGDMDVEAVDEYVRALGSKEALSAALNWYRANTEQRTLKGPALGSVDVPALQIWSDGDTAICRDGAELTKNYVSGPYQLEVIPDIDHWVVDKAPARVNELLLEQLRNYPLQ
jgi:pimeloyl-ACP methyl ester carboxylesterase